MTTESGVPEPEPGRRRHVRQGHRWTKLNVRRQLRILDARLGHWPSLREYRKLAERDHRLPPADDVLRVHGSWSAARIAVTQTQRVPSLRTLHRSYMAGATPRELSERIGVFHDTILIAFKEAGLPLCSHAKVAAKRREHVDRRLRAEIINTFRRTGSIAATAQFTGANKERVRRILAEAGVDVKAYRSWQVNRGGVALGFSPEEARRALRRAARNTRGRFTRKQYQELAKTRTSSGRAWPSPDTLAKALGVFTWNEALTAAGLSTGPSSGVRSRPRDKELAEIRRLAKRLKRPPTMSEYDANRGAGLLTAQALTKRTAGWRDMLEASGLGPPK